MLCPPRLDQESEDYEDQEHFPVHRAAANQLAGAMNRVEKREVVFRREAFSRIRCEAVTESEIGAEDLE
jgi:hypothetical protein